MPRIGAGALGFQTQLLVTGMAHDPRFGGSGPQMLTTLDAGQVFVLLIEEDTQFVTVSAERGNVNFIAAIETLGDGQVLYLREPGLSVAVNQQAAPAGEMLGARPWQLLGEVRVAPDNDTLEVVVNSAAPGIVAADGVRLVALEQAGLGLDLLTLTGNPLDDRAHELFIPALIDEGVEVRFDANAAPVIGAVADIGSALPSTVVRVPVVVQDAEDHPIVIAATSDRDGVDVSVAGGEILISAVAGFAGTARITVTASELGLPGTSAGRVGSASFDYTSAANAVYGTKYWDRNGDGVRQAHDTGLDGVAFFLDLDDDGVRDAAEPSTFTDANGHYRLTLVVDPPASPPDPVIVAEVLPAGWSAGTTRRLVSFGGPGELVLDVDFGNTASGVVDVGPDLTAFEGDAISLAATLNDPDSSDGASFDYLWRVFDAHAVQIASGNGGTLEFTVPDDGTYRVTLAVTDLDDPVATVYGDELVIVAMNVAPTLVATGPETAEAGAPFAVSLGATDPGEDTISGWVIGWGDGAVEQVAGDAESASHVYAAPGEYAVTVRATDEDGSYDAAPLMLSVEPARLDVVSFDPTETGFRVRFDRPLNAAVLNLYDTELDSLGAADVVLIGEIHGTVRGSLLVDPDGRGIVFHKTGGMLAPDTYRVILRSAADGFSDQAGRLLDGDGDGASGGDYANTFVCIPDSAATLALDEFARGPGQEVNLPAPASNGIALTLTSTGGIGEVSFALSYDPALLSVGGVAPGLDLPAGASIDSTEIDAGTMSVTVESPTPLPSGTIRLLRFEATVPDGAPYGAIQLLDLSEVRFDAGEPGRADDGLHVVAYFGDASGNGTDTVYSTLDAQRLQRVNLGLDQGFGAYPSVDPTVVADISGNGVLSTLDVSRLLQEVNFVQAGATTDRPEIPPVPKVVPSVSSGPDVRVVIGQEFSVQPGAIVTVPIALDAAAGLESVQLRLAYDAASLTLLDTRRGSVTADFGWYVVSNVPGLLSVDMSRLSPVTSAGGTLLMLDFQVKPGAVLGRSALDLQAVRINDAGMTPNPMPQPGGDASDGAIDISVPLGAEPTQGLLSVIAQALRAVAGTAAAASGAAYGQDLHTLSQATVPAANDATSSTVATEAPTLAKPQRGVLSALPEALRRWIGSRFGADAIVAERYSVAMLEAVAAPAAPAPAVQQQAPVIELAVKKGAAPAAALADATSQDAGKKWLRGFLAAPQTKSAANSLIRISVPTLGETTPAAQHQATPDTAR